MRIFLAGATGVVGRYLVPLLVSAGHEVVATTRAEAKAGRLRAAGAEPVVVDALSRDDVVRAVAAAKPDVVVHQLTGLSGPMDFKHVDRTFATTNRLRTAGVDYLLEGAEKAGATRFVAQSYAGWPSGRSGPSVKTEDAPLDASPVPASRETHAAILHLENAVVSAPLKGVVLRYGAFYGPGAGLGAGGEQLELVRARKLPLVGNGAGIWSFAHLEDVASATLAAIESRAVGVYHVVDDEPAPVREWLPFLAEAVGAKRPPRIPTWLARPLIGEFGVAMMTEIRGASNARIKRELGWKPAYRTWREGFRTGLGSDVP